MASSQKAKGDRVERQIVDRHSILGIDTARVPLSGASGGEFSGDVHLEVPSVGFLVGEVKARKDGSGFKVLENWLGRNDVLFLVRDRKEPLVVLPWETYKQFVEALTGAYGNTIDIEEESEWDEDEDPQ